MPAKVLTDDVPETVPKFSVVGMYEAGKASRFVQHVAILQDDASLRFGGANARVWHMGPPLVAGINSAKDTEPDKSTCLPHVIGMIDLDADDIEGMETWLEDVDKENPPVKRLEQYVIHPAMCWEYAENGVRKYRRFSCVGFVSECYRSAGVNLLDDSEPSKFPDIDLETVAAVYDRVRNEKLRAKFGMSGPGPWKIALAGYLFHSLERHSGLVRGAAHVPASIDERHFPFNS